MKFQTAAGAAALVVTATATLIGPPVVSAEPVAPQPDTPCSESLAGALTQLPDLKTVLQCRNQQSGEYRWQSFGSPYPNSDRWLTYGPQLILHGEGQPNREIDSGDWTAYPQASGGQCRLPNTTVIRAGELSRPQVSTGEPGQPLKLRVLPLLFTIELTGYCLWQKVQ